MSNDLWRWADPDGQQRRVRLDELRAALAGGHIAPNTPVWRSGWIGWQSAHEVPELQSSALSAANGVVPNIPPPPLAMVAMQHAFEAKAGGTFSQPPPAPAGARSEEPPPPPHYVPVAVKPNSIPPAGPSSGRLSATGTGPQQAQPSTSTLPTTVGLPPSPELMAMVEPHRPGIPGVGPSLLVPAANGGAAKDPMIEELSGSMLLDDSGSSGTATIHARGYANLPPPTDPVLRGGDLRPAERDTSEDELAGLRPRRRLQLTAIFEDLNEMKAGRPPKNKLLIGVIAFIGLMLIISLLALVVSAIRGKPSELPSADTSGSSSAGLAGSAFSRPPVTETAPSASAPPVVANVAKDEPKAPSSETLRGDCTTAGEAHVVSPRAFIQSGVEAVAVPGAIALGFATDPRNGVALTVDPASIGITSTVKARAFGGDARRMSPVLEKGRLTLLPDVDKKGDPLRTRRVVATNPLIDVGAAENAIVWAPHGQNGYAKIFSLDGEGTVDAVRAVPLATGKGIAVAFRRGNAIYIGVAKGEGTLTAEGTVAKIAGLGQVGSPTIATSGDAILVAWSDRATGGEPWQVRWTKLTAGAAPDDPRQLVLPEGGLGVQAMSPSIAGLGAGRFVMAWSEGTPSHQVRAQTFAADGTPMGAPLLLSAAGINAGQPQIAVGSDGRGVVAFLAAKGKGYEVHATPVACAAK